jgi:hypothetical protein
MLYSRFILSNRSRLLLLPRFLRKMSRLRLHQTPLNIGLARCHGSKGVNPPLTLPARRLGRGRGLGERQAPVNSGWRLMGRPGVSAPEGWFAPAGLRVNLGNGSPCLQPGLPHCRLSALTGSMIRGAARISSVCRLKGGFHAANGKRGEVLTGGLTSAPTITSAICPPEG